MRPAPTTTALLVTLCVLSPAGLTACASTQAARDDISCEEHAQQQHDELRAFLKENEIGNEAVDRVKMRLSLTMDKLRKNLKDQDNIEVAPETEIIALIAYLQRLGQDIKVSQANQ